VIIGPGIIAGARSAAVCEVFMCRSLGMLGQVVRLFIRGVIARFKSQPRRAGHPDRIVIKHPRTTSFPACRGKPLMLHVMPLISSSSPLNRSLNEKDFSS
jgi:hypothetical protein